MSLAPGTDVIHCPFCDSNDVNNLGDPFPEDAWLAQYFCNSCCLFFNESDCWDANAEQDDGDSEARP